MPFDDKKIDSISQKIDRARVKNKNKTQDHAAVASVMDKYTVETINKFLANNKIQEFVGIISAGKESNVYFAYGENKTPLAIKVYKVDPINTKWMKNYIIGDPRFKKIGTSTHKIIYTWCSKEYKNLQEMERAGLPVPKPIAAKNNVLVMSFIGDSNGTPAPRLKDAELENDPHEELETSIGFIRKMYLEAHLVHGDLSEFNILYYQGKQYVIDVSQAVSIYHTNAPVYLERDLKNVIKYYNQYSI